MAHRASSLESRLLGQTAMLLGAVVVVKDARPRVVPVAQQQRIDKRHLCDTAAKSYQPSEAVSWLATDHPHCLCPDRLFRTSTVAQGNACRHGQLAALKNPDPMPCRQGRPHRKVEVTELGR
jgi:hypothetical protein